MNRKFSEDLVTSSVFNSLPEETQQFIRSTMSGPGETASTGGTIASKGAALEVVSMEVLTPVPTVLRFPRQKHTPVHETHTLMKYK